jgi:RNA ligase (TIGR02306 family)
MSSLIVEVCRIDRVMPHPNADLLELAHIKGWQCVVPKGKYAAGDLVTYVPIDAVLPPALSDRLGVTKYLSNGRVRCAKLRGEPSFGLIMDREDPSWAEGADVREHYGITKYVPPLRPSAGDAEAAHPLFVSYTDVENLRNFPAVFAGGEDVVVTEKLHGTNCRVGMVEGELMAGSMEVRRKRPDQGREASSTYWFPTTLPGVTALLGELAASDGCRQAILFGEVFGSKVQNLHYGRKGELGFAAFDLMADGRYLDAAEFGARCARHGVPTVPVLHRGPFSLDLVRRLSDGPTTVGGRAGTAAAADHIREGVVVRPAVERTDPKVGRVILKYIGDSYLFAKGITDADDV